MGIESCIFGTPNYWLYSALIDRISAVACALWDEGHREEIYRAMLVLSDHAAGQSGCSGSQIRMAQSAHAGHQPTRESDPLAHD